MKIFKNLIAKSIVTAAIMGFAATTVHAASGINLKLTSAQPDFVPVKVQTTNQCRLKLTFKNAGSGIQAGGLTMDHEIILRGDFYYRNVHYKSKTLVYPDLVLNKMNPGQSMTFAFNSIRIAGPTRIKFRVNSHPGGGVAELTKANNSSGYSLNCIGNLQG